jgi:hypothetical protein
MTTIELKDYNLLGNLADESSAIDSFIGEYDSGYVCDVISEIADRFIPIYNYDVWEHAKDIQEYIEEAIDEGLVSTDGRDIDLIKIFQGGYYVYYQRSLYDNLDNMVFNMIAEKVNEHLDNQNEEAINLIDLGEIESEIESISFNYDNNNKMSDIHYEANRIIQAIANGEFMIEVA